MTSAPRSPSMEEQTGPCCQMVQSITRIPSRGMAMASFLLQVVGAAEAPRLGVDAHVHDGDAVRGERALEGRADLLRALDVGGVSVDHLRDLLVARGEADV